MKGMNRKQAAQDVDAWGAFRVLLQMESQVMVTDGKHTETRGGRWMVFVGPTKRPRKYSAGNLCSAMTKALEGEMQRRGV